MNILEQTKNGVPVLYADGIEAAGGAVHGFSTRKGGVSQGIFASLNLGLTRGDDPEHVRENYRRFLSAVGTMDKTTFAMCNQVHGDTVRAITTADVKSDLYGKLHYEADGMMTAIPGVALVVFSADCIPVLLYDPVRRVIAALHSGWRGTAAGIVTRAVERMEEVYGCRPENILAAIGPGIGPCCFETHEDVPNAMMAAVARNNLIALAVFFRADGGGGHNAVFLDRPHQIVHRLIVLHLVGVLPERMERMKLRHFQIDDFSLFHRAGRHVRRGRQIDLRRRDCRLLNRSGLARLYRLSGFRRRRTAGARFLALVSFLTSGHFVPNSGRGLLPGRLVNLRRAACAGLRRFLLFPRRHRSLLFRGTAPALFRLIRLRRFFLRDRSLFTILISSRSL